MDTRTEEIVAQVAFKGAVDIFRDIDLTSAQGQAEFIEGFSFLHDALRNAVTAVAGPEEQAANLIRGNFPGTTNVASNEAPSYNPPPAYVPSNGGGQGPHNFQLTVKGAQHGPLPDWLFEAAAAKGVTEVYDNRDRAATNPKYPMFKATTGGPNATPFWAPR